MAIDTAGVYAVTTILSGLATGAVLLRFYVRRLKRVKIGPDDWTVLAGMVRPLPDLDSLFTLSYHDD